jgi:hypothetical protein
MAARSAARTSPSHKAIAASRSRAQQRQNGPPRISRTAYQIVKIVLTRQSFCFCGPFACEGTIRRGLHFTARDTGGSNDQLCTLSAPSIYFDRLQASTLIRLAQMSPDASRAAALLLLANERLVLANQREPRSTEQQVPILLRNKAVCQR